ncbi:class I SAM-dependent methyltransferase [Paraburkholderia sp. Ac-20340]|uniref:methyltransferase n=1 Tax=Paraburkholderia sp. Ac-20340 TaxID=2703888 RepID=UPI00197D15DD|nr:class I SAM-dependent methyltransferase [Paraburkholderia sp. Ac-20340]MBN3858334.1 class I SAM-dependent methyltransferase [Paraburkholderia sp. Ac-20340]
MTDFPTLSWPDTDGPRTVRWRSEAGVPAPKRVVVADDRTTADAAYRLACEGTALLWRGDYQNARQLLQAMARRAERKPRKGEPKAPATPLEAFHLHRQAQAQRARTLGMVLLPLEGDYSIALRRAPDVKLACEEAWGAPDGAPSAVSLREVLGLIGAHEWRRKGVPIPALGGAHVHPYYGVFSPVRGEYLDLIARVPLPAAAVEKAFDIGTGTGVISAVLAQRGVKHIVATDQDTRALACARENLDMLGVGKQVEVMEADLFPPGRAPLVVCNPPWVPARPASPIEYAVFDPDSRMLRGFLGGLKDHLEPGGEGWLILSDFAEHLGLRTRDELLDMIGQAGLDVAGREDIRPRHPKASDPNDPLHRARAAEITSLWRLKVRSA